MAWNLTLTEKQRAHWCFVCKESACQSRRRKRRGFNPWVGRFPWSRKWQPAPACLPGKIPWTEGYSPWGCKESDTAEHTHTCLHACVCTHMPSTGLCAITALNRGVGSLPTDASRVAAPFYIPTNGVPGLWRHF